MENANSLHVISATGASTPHTDQNATHTFRHINMNSSPVFWLPTETLQAIFIRCASDHHYGEDHGFCTETPPSWVNISYVCRHWRSVALNCPILWTFLFAVSPRWMEELLSRSTQAPLKLHLAEGIPLLGQTPLAMTLLEKVANHAERIQELDLSLNSLLPEQLISKLFSHAPLLQKVKLTVDIFPEQDWSQSILNTPVLHTLEVLRYPVPWDSFTLRSVRTLSLRYLHLHSQPTTEQFLATLSCMQVLEHLYVSSVLPSAVGFLSSSAFRTFHKINLPCLSRLLISAPLSTIIVLLSCINIPLRTEIRLLYHSESTDDDTVLSPLFARRFGTLENHTLSSPTIRSLSVNFEDHEPGDSMMSVSFSSHDDHPFYCSMEKSWGDGIPLKIVTERSESMTDNENRIMTIICSIPLIDVHSIRVCHPPFSSRFWQALLGHFPNLCHLELFNGHLPDIAPALYFTATADEQEGRLDGARAQHQILVPKLETLSLYYMWFGEDSLNSDGDGDAPEELPADAQTLLDALASRTESPGQLTTALCTLRLVGRLGSGHFRIVDDDDA